MVIMQFSLFGKCLNRMVTIWFYLFLLIPAFISGETVDLKNISQETTRGNNSGLKNLYHSLFQPRKYNTPSSEPGPSKPRIPEIPVYEDIKNLLLELLEE